MLARKLDSKTIAMIRARADFFFQEQLKRLGPVPSPIIAHSSAPPRPKRGRPRKQPAGVTP